MKLITIPKEKYEDYRLDLIFNGYKWDPQFFDNNTIAKHVLVITKEEFDEIEKSVVALSRETIEAENFLLNNLKITKVLALPRQTHKQLRKMTNYNPKKHIRLMRFDFHPVVGGGFAISEVNSDVPGGFAEASIIPRIAIELFKGKKYWYKDFGEILAIEIAKKTKVGGKIAFVHCTSYSDDRQVMQFIGEKLEDLGRIPIYCAADHLKFDDQKAISILDGNSGEVDAIFRFTPLEWLIGMNKAWHGYFDTLTASCNHPVSIFAQTKRFPLIWNTLEKLGVDLSVWRSLLPNTVDVKDAKGKDGYIYKPACGRVGEGITIKDACRADEYEKIIKDVKRNPKRYIAQKMFKSLPLVTAEGESFHVCIGAYSVEGNAAGFYARISKTARIDSYSADIPVIIENDQR